MTAAKALLVSSKARRLAATAVIGLILGALAAAFVHPDIYPALRTWGVSLGTNTRYCSADVVAGRPEFSCQASR